MLNFHLNNDEHFYASFPTYGDQGYLYEWSAIRCWFLVYVTSACVRADQSAEVNLKLSQPDLKWSHHDLQVVESGLQLTDPAVGWTL